MKKIHSYILKGLCTFVFMFLVVASASHVQAYSANQYQYQQQFSDGRYQYQVYAAPIQTQYYDQRLQQLLEQIAQLQRLLLQLQAGSIHNSDYDYDSDYESNSDSEIELLTRAANDITDDSARLRGEVLDFNRSDYADVWFELGTSRNNLDKRTPIERIDEDETEDFFIRVANLRDDTRYYFRAVGEDDDEEKEYGSILEFRTRDDGRYNDDYDYDDREDEPDVSTSDAFDIGRSSARIEGAVDMNDFRNGEVFLVYGEDEDEIDDIANDFYSYADVDEDGDDVRKFRVARNQNNDSTYKLNINGLYRDTDYYFTLCVGYEDEDNDEVLECSSTRDFTTD